jgi:hypothetical protein
VGRENEVMLSIGVVAGGIEIKKMYIGQLINRLACVVSEQRGKFRIGAIAALNVVFHVPGSVYKQLEFEGLRDGTFSRKLKLLMIQVAVPKKLVTCEDEEVITKFLFNSLREANKIAAKYFEKKGIEYSEPEYLALVDAVEAKLREDWHTRNGP